MRCELLIAFSMLVFGCDCTTDHPEDSGGRDSGPPDTGRPDTGLDTGSDGDTGPGDPQFAGIEGLPSGCVVAQARNPGAISAHRFERCLDGREGCEQLVVDWGEFGGFRVYQPHYAATEQALLVHRVPYNSDSYATTVARPDGSIVGALRSAPRCGLTIAFSTTEAEYGFGIKLAGAESSFLVRGAWDGTEVATTQLASPFSTRTVMSVGLAANRTVAHLTGDALVEWTEDHAPGEVEQLLPSEGVAGSLAREFVLGEGFSLFLYAPGLHYAMGLESEAGVVRFLGTPPSLAVYDVAYDGTYLAWAEGRGPADDWLRYDERVVKVARFNPNPDLLVPAREIELGAGDWNRIGVGGGWLAIRTDEFAYRMVRIEDGLEVLIEPPEGMVFAHRPAWILPHQVALHLANGTSGVNLTLWKIVLP